MRGLIRRPVQNPPARLPPYITRYSSVFSFAFRAGAGFFDGFFFFVAGFLAIFFGGSVSCIAGSRRSLVLREFLRLDRSLGAVNRLRPSGGGESRRGDRHCGMVLFQRLQPAPAIGRQKPPRCRSAPPNRSGPAPIPATGSFAYASRSSAGDEPAHELSPRDLARMAPGP